MTSVARTTLRLAGEPALDAFFLNFSVSENKALRLRRFAYTMTTVMITTMTMTVLVMLMIRTQLSFGRHILTVVI